MAATARDAATKIHALQCRCGTVRGTVSHPRHMFGRGICYCRDCQAYAQALGHPEAIVDAWGGTDIVATRPQHVAFSAGTGMLACLSLGPRGLLRWYARCCDTPIGNTSRDPRMPYVGLVHACLGETSAIDRAFGPVTMHVNRASAHGNPAPTRLGIVRCVVRLAPAMLLARFRRQRAASPFFHTGGEPRVAPRVLTRAQRDAAYAAASRLR